MFNKSSLLDELDNTTSHPLVSDLVPDIGESLTMAIVRIYAEKSYTSIPTSTYIRELLVDQIKLWLKHDNLLFQLEGDQRSFKQGFLEIIREDPAYQDIIPNSRSRQNIRTLSDDTNLEINKYLTNKLESTVELIPLDAMMLAMASGMHCMIYEQSTADDVVDTKLLYSHFDKSEEYLHHLWIFLYDKDNGKFLIRNNNATAAIDNADI
jgi:hypothetical protein